MYTYICKNIFSHSKTYWKYIKLYPIIWYVYKPEILRVHSICADIWFAVFHHSCNLCTLMWCATFAHMCVSLILAHFCVRNFWNLRNGGGGVVAPHCFHQREALSPYMQRPPLYEKARIKQASGSKCMGREGGGGVVAPPYFHQRGALSPSMQRPSIYEKAMRKQASGSNCIKFVLMEKYCSPTSRKEHLYFGRYCNIE